MMDTQTRENQMSTRKYVIGNSSITIIFGDITKSTAEVIVSSDDYMLSMGGGVSRSIRNACGSQVWIDARKMIPAKLGDVVITSAGDLDAKYIFHAITIGNTQLDASQGRYCERTSDRDDALALSPSTIARVTTHRVIHLMEQLGCKSVAFPAIGAGAAGIPYDVVAREMASSLATALLGSHLRLDIELYLYDRTSTMTELDFIDFFEEFAALRGLRVSARGNISALSAHTGTSFDSLREIRSSASNQTLGVLNSRALILEQKLLRTGDSDHQHRIQGQLEEIALIMRSLEMPFADRMERLTRRKSSGVGNLSSDASLSVYVASIENSIGTFELAARHVIAQNGFRCFNDYIDNGKQVTDIDERLRAVREADVFLCILGYRYGQVDAASGLSIAELEFTQAVRSGKRIIYCQLDKTAELTVDMIESDPQSLQMLLDFKDSLKFNAANRVRFADTSSLEKGLTNDLVRLQARVKPKKLTVFISYRRDDSQDVVGRIYDKLVAAFSPEQVIRDIDSLIIGRPFPEALNDAVSQSEIVLVIIGKNWLTASDSDGVRRLDDAGDFVRMEIERALAAGKHVVPVLVSNASMPLAKDLPESIRSLVNQHGIQVRPDPDFHGDMDRLIRQLKRVG
jgi:O-acetyl-ADP-ribose deacetylase (regulator of RNase III)